MRSLELWTPTQLKDRQADRDASLSEPLAVGRDHLVLTRVGDPGLTGRDPRLLESHRNLAAPLDQPADLRVDLIDRGPARRDRRPGHIAQLLLTTHRYLLG